MRFSLSILFMAMAFLGCSSGPEMMNLTGTVRGLKKGTLLLQKFDDTVLVTVDSLIVNGNPEFGFREKIDSPEIYYLYIRLKDGSLRDDRIIFFAENGDINIQTNLANFGSAARISGSKNDSLLKDYNRLKQRYISQNLDVIEQRLKARAEPTDSLIATLDKKQGNILSGKYFATINFALNHSEYEIAPYLMLSEASNSQVKYLDTVYNALSPKIKDSKYGKELESLIINSKEVDTLL